LFHVGAFMVFREAVVYAVFASAVAADVGDEFFRSADGAAFHRVPLFFLGGLLLS